MMRGYRMPQTADMRLQLSRGAASRERGLRAGDGICAVAVFYKRI